MKYLSKFRQSCFLIVLFISVFCSRAQVWQWATMHDVNGEGWAVTNDNNGNTFLASFFSGTCVLGTTTVTGTGIKGVITKYDLNGNLLWARYVLSGAAYGVDCDNNGNVYSSGYFTGTLTVGSQTFVSAGSVDIYVIKYDTNGNVIWVKTAGGTGPEYSNAISIDSQDNPVITGYVAGSTATFGTISVTSTVTSYYVAKYDPSGNCQWVTSSPSGNSQGLAVSSDLNGNVYVSGTHQGVIIGTSTLSTNGLSDYFIAKFNSNGVPLWVNSGGTSGSDAGVNVSVDPYGEVYLLGRFTGSVLVVAGQTLNPANSGQDMFLAKYTTGGTSLWAQAYTYTGSQQPYGLAAYNGGVYFTVGIGVANYAIGNFSFTSTSTTDGLLLANVGSAGNLQYATALSGGGDDVMALHMDNMCNLTLGGDLFANNVQVGTSVFTHTAGEALFVAKFNSGNTTPTLSITGPTTLCPGSTVTLSVNGASTYTWSNGIIGNSITVSPATNTSYAVIGISPSYTCQAKLTQNISVIQTSVSVNASSTLICQGNSATISILGANTYTWSNSNQTASVVVSPTLTSTYSVTGIGTTGCNYQAMTTISVLTSPSLSTSATQFTVCKGNKILISASGANTYTWNTGVHTNTISATAQSNINYIVSGTGTLNTCVASKTIQVSVSPCTAILEETKYIGLSVFPNPGNGAFNFRLNGDNEYCEVIIYDMTGQPQMRFLLDGDIPEKTITLTEKGIYFANIINRSGGTQYRKLIME